MKKIRLKSNPKLCYCIQKLAAFVLIYMIAAVVFEMIIIGAYSILGYDVLNGKMPEGDFVRRIPSYGRAGFVMITLLYVKFIEKGIIIGAMMVSIMVGVFLITGLGKYEGIGNISISSFFLWGIACFIQSFTEEFMCRGFLQNSLSKKVDVRIAILICVVSIRKRKNVWSLTKSYMN